jgi:nucleoside-diphosphate-sugar epimerase
MRNPPDQPHRALVLGVTGGFGYAMAAALARRGTSVQALVRNPAAVTPAMRAAIPGLTIVTGDARRAEDVVAAAAGTHVIVHAVNPRNYQRWREDAIPMLAASIDAAEATGARILFPGNVYVFSPASGAIVDEATPHTPNTRKGAVRRDMEAMLAEAARTRAVRSVILRVGDFFGPDKVSSWLTGAMATRVTPPPRSMILAGLVSVMPGRTCPTSPRRPAACSITTPASIGSMYTTSPATGSTPAVGWPRRLRLRCSRVPCRSRRFRGGRRGSDRW